MRSVVTVVLVILFILFIIGMIGIVHMENVREDYEKSVQSKYKQCINDCHLIIKNYTIGDIVSNEDINSHDLCLNICNLNLQEKMKKFRY